MFKFIKLMLENVRLYNSLVDLNERYSSLQMANTILKEKVIALEATHQRVTPSEVELKLIYEKYYLDREQVAKKKVK